mmetsp:Transcript_8665/g.12742  ORF Transcript_8665/g.12742 Transcript_8665/m.12742 type:complete len:192 (+) Transcript_8665:850-1425(+)
MTDASSSPLPSMQRNILQCNSCPANPFLVNQLFVPVVSYRNAVAFSVESSSGRTCLPTTKPISSYNSLAAASLIVSSSLPSWAASTPPWGHCQDPGTELRSPTSKRLDELTTAIPTQSLHFFPSESITNLDGGYLRFDVVGADPDDIVIVVAVCCTAALAEDINGNVVDMKENADAIGTTDAPLDEIVMKM